MPIEKKSTSLAKRSAITATAGTSTMMPSGTFGAPSAARTCSHSARRAVTSAMRVTIGNMIESAPGCEPCAAAR